MVCIENSTLSAILHTVHIPAQPCITSGQFIENSHVMQETCWN
jgi:hypothetical protein